MKRAMCIGAAVVLSVSHAWGGTVGFDPPVQVVDLGDPVSIVTFEVFVSETEFIHEFTGIDVYVGSHDMDVVDFVLDSDFVAQTALNGEIFSDIVLSNDGATILSLVFFGGFSMTPFSAPLRLGTLTMDVADLPPGAYFLELFYEWPIGYSVIASGLPTEKLTGFANVVVVSADSQICETDSDCDGGDHCADDLCFAGLCGHPFNDAPCDDQNPCTESDSCWHGVCAGTPVSECCLFDKECDDDDICSDDRCIEHACISAAIENCCTTNPQCFDWDDCTYDWCENNRCVNLLHTDECDDDDPCTQDDRCGNGICTGLPVSDCCHEDDECSNNDECTDDTCIDYVCFHQPNAATCDDGNVCTDDDQCGNGVCTGFAVPGCCNDDEACQDGIDCTVDYCLDNVCVSLFATAACDDGDPCTGPDACVNGDCVGDPVPDCCIVDNECNDGVLCTNDVCENNQCVYQPNTDPCDDGDPCTGPDFCSNGACAGTSIADCCSFDLDCDDGDVCTNNLCIVNRCTTAFNDAPCDDDDTCTEFDTCRDGACQGIVREDCCVVDAECEDGASCTDDTCLDNTCVHTPILDCEAAAGGVAGLPPPPTGTRTDVNDKPGERVGTIRVEAGDPTQAATSNDQEPAIDGETDSPASSLELSISSDAQEGDDQTLGVGPRICGVTGALTWSIMFLGLVVPRRIRCFRDKAKGNQSLS